MKPRTLLIGLAFGTLAFLLSFGPLLFQEVLAAQASGNSVTTTGTGASDWVSTPPRGEFLVFVEWAGGAGDADLQIGPPDGSFFVDFLDGAGGNSGSVINFTADGYARIPGGCTVLLDVNTHTSAATMTVVPIDYPWGPAQ